MFNWNQYLDFAKLQVSNGNEVSYRCAISRAYYAAYNLARLKVIELKLETKPPEILIHQWVWKAYQKYGTRDSWAISKQGFELKVFRERADYDDVIDEISDVTADAIKRAEELCLLIHMFG